MDPVEIIDTLDAPLSRMERRMVEFLAARTRFGRWVETSRVMDVLYADDPDGGPEFGRECVYVFAHSANKKLRPAGLKIESEQGRGARHRRLISIPIEQKEAA